MGTSSKGGATVGLLWPIAEPLARSLGLILWEIRFVKEGSGWFLRFFIDTPEGVTLDDCEAFSRAIEPVLDERDPIPHAYCLEVSSPGTERELTRDFHFDFLMGEEIHIRLIRPRDGRRDFIGRLTGFSDGIITIEEPDGPVALERKETAWCRLVDEYFGG